MTFILRTNADYAAWCKTFYADDALDARGMRSLDGLHAWQEQEKRIAAAVADTRGTQVIDDAWARSHWSVLTTEQRRQYLAEFEAEIARLIAEAVAVDRERCAAICDVQAAEPECPERAAYCAEAIRGV